MSQPKAETVSDEGAELAFLNQNHSFPLETLISSQLKDTGDPEAGQPSPLLVRGKRWLKEKSRGLLLRSVFASYLEREQKYQANLVRLLNAWDLRHERDLHGVRHALAIAQNRLATAESVIRGLERIVATAGKAASESSSSARAFTSANASVGEQSATPAVSFEKDYSYLLLENRFRGSEEEIEERMRWYVPVLQSLPGPVLEIGSGRGELLALLKSSGIESYGVELDAAMVERGTARGLDTRLENGIAHLEASSPQTFGAVIAIQVLEHFPFDLLKRFLELSRSRVRPGGLVIAETIDTSSLVALSQNYFRDPTHTAPLHPETLSYLFELAGLEVVEVKRRSPFPPGFELQHVADGTLAADGTKTFNENVDKLNSLLYGFQDYAIIAKVNR